MLKFKVKKTGIFIKDWKWKAVARNGRIMASGRGFNSKALAIESINTIVRYIKEDNFSVEHEQD